VLRADLLFFRFRGCVALSLVWKELQGLVGLVLVGRGYGHDRWGVEDGRHSGRHLRWMGIEMGQEAVTNSLDV
jgi:hypothetical protein